MPMVAAFAVVLALAVAAAVLAATARRAPQAAPRSSGLPASISTSLSNLMQLSPMPATAAPDFTLTDQNGHTMSMSGFHGKVVVLEFMDPHCTDICPIVSQEFVDAYRDLSPALRSRVVFMAVNVNPYHSRVSDMAAYSNEQHLSSIPSWHFFTGPVPTLRTVWKDYHIAVDAPSPNADVIHSSVVYFISPSGQERYVASPMDDHTASGKAYLPASQLLAWGHGIAQVAGSLAR